MAWTTLTKLRKALVERAGEIYAERNPFAPGESPIKGEDLTSEQLESVAAEVLEELGNMDQTPVQHEMPVETTLEKRGAKATRISTSGGSSVDPAIPRLFVGSCTKYVRPFYVCTVAVTFVFRPLSCCVLAP